MTKKKTIKLSEGRVINKATLGDFSIVIGIIEQGKSKMIKSGNYPALDTVKCDILLGDCYLLFEGDKPIATFVFKSGPEPTYLRIDNGRWLDNQSYYVIHRVASVEGVHGVMSDIIAYCSSFTSSIRIDTHADNRPMLAALARLDFSYCGIIYLENGTSRLAYQRVF